MLGALGWNIEARGKLIDLRGGTATVVIVWSAIDLAAPIGDAKRSNEKPVAFADSIGLTFASAEGACAVADRVAIKKAIIKTATPLKHVQRRIERFPVVKS